MWYTIFYNWIRARLFLIVAFCAHFHLIRGVGNSLVDRGIRIIKNKGLIDKQFKPFLVFLHSFPQMLLDIICVFFSYWFAFVIRFEMNINIPPYYMHSFSVWIPWITLISLLSFALFRFYNTMWQFKA